MMFRVRAANVPGTRNTRNPRRHRNVPGVPGVPGLPARVRTHEHVCIAHAHINYFPRVHTRNTRNTRNNQVAMRLSDVPGTRNTANRTRNMQNNKPLRQTMPTIAGWIDALRDALGQDMINAAIRAGIDGQPTFHAKENGQTIGTPRPTEKNATAAHRCKQCAHYARPGMSSGYCAERADLPAAYGPANPLRKLPADAGAACNVFSNIN